MIETFLIKYFWYAALAYYTLFVASIIYGILVMGFRAIDKSLKK